jgi:hypothetical protein
VEYQNHSCRALDAERSKRDTRNPEKTSAFYPLYHRLVEMMLNSVHVDQHNEKRAPFLPLRRKQFDVKSNCVNRLHAASLTFG